jgi:hypothetical protein
MEMDEGCKNIAHNLLNLCAEVSSEHPEAKVIGIATVVSSDHNDGDLGEGRFYHMRYTSL